MLKNIIRMIAAVVVAMAIILPTTAHARDGIATITGSLTSIDPQGMFITVALNRSTDKTYYINSNTIYRKNSGVVDISEMYVGDVVSLKLVGADSSLVEEVTIQAVGTQVENIYRGTITAVNSAMNRLTVRNERAFEDWELGASAVSNPTQTTAKFQSNTPIYVGNKKISKTALKKYLNSDVYYVTTKQFGQEIIKQMVVREANERTYYEPMTAVDTRYKFMKLATTGNLYFHNGSILVRNGRLIKPTGLTTEGQVYAVTDGHTRNNFVHVAQVMHDSFLSANFAGHELYFGKLSQVDTNYLVELQMAVKYEHNNWRYTSADPVLSYSNTTTTHMNMSNSFLTLKPQEDRLLMENKYGYFYVKNGHIQAMHLLEATQAMTTITAVGRVESINLTNDEMTIKDVAEWSGPSFIKQGRYVNMKIDQALIIKGGKVITPQQIKVNNRIVIISDGGINGAVLLVD